MSGTAALTIDVDSIGCYRAIHGQGGPVVSAVADPIYRHALPRLMELLDGRPATLFLIGQDADTHRSALQSVMRPGLELASHSYRHDYRLTRKPAAQIDADLAAAETAIAAVAGLPPVGFRAPGYNVNATLLRVLAERGYLYDSSLLPAPAYFWARAAVRSWYDLRGRSSQSLIGDPRAFFGPLQSYRTTFVRYWEPHPAGRLLEWPIGVEPSTRLPIIGTSWVLAPDPVRKALLTRLDRCPEFVFEMHAIDVLDPSEAPAELVAHQPDLRISARTKVARLRELFDRLAGGFALRTLAEASWDRAATVAA